MVYMTPVNIIAQALSGDNTSREICSTYAIVCTMSSRKNRPLVSVIVPVYNVEKYVDKCLDSIESQTYTNIEIIVVNDASPGNISEIVSSRKNIKYVDLKKNGGLFRARVEGMTVAKGDYVLNVDADDTISFDFIDRMVARAQETSADIVLCEMVRYNEADRSKEVLNLAKSIGFDDVLEGRSAALGELLRKGNYFWEVCGKLYSSAAIDAAMKDLAKIKRHTLMGEDMLFNIHLFYYSNSVARAEFAYYYYLINDSSITSKSVDVAKKTRVLNDLCFVFDTARNFLESKGVFDDYEKGYRHVRNVQAAKYHNDIMMDFKGEDRRTLLLSAGKLAFDEKGYLSEIEIQSASLVDDIKDLRWRLESMNSVKLSGLKFLSNVKRKLKSVAS